VGLQNQDTECYGGDALPPKKLDDSQCAACNVDKSLGCGGCMISSVYSTEDPKRIHYYARYNNYCATAQDEDTEYTEYPPGNGNLQKCQEGCDAEGDCTAFEFFEMTNHGPCMETK